MENAELLRYIKDAIDLETDLLTQEQILNQSCAAIQQRIPSLDLLPEPTATVWIERKDHWSMLFLGSWIGIPLVILAFWLGGDWTLMILVLASIFFAPGIKEVYTEYSHREDNKQIREQLRIDSDRVAQHNRTISEEHSNAVALCTKSESALRAAAQPHIAQTRTLLNKLYAQNIIYPKYRTLPALTSIYEYFMTGRCTELTGPNGAYNLYETEVRADTIISQLNTVIENLEKIRQNQYMLYQQVSAIQANTSRIVSELQQIEGYTIYIAQLTALNAYYAALNERNNRITMYYHL